MVNDIIQGIPNIVPDEKTAKPSRGSQKEFYANISNIKLENIQASFGIALHMHQPTIPAGGDDVHSAAMISNLRHMWDHMGTGDNHNAPVFFWCYQRMAEFIPELVAAGKNPRVMLDYSGNLLWALREIKDGEAIEKLKTIASDSKYFLYAEWLGTMWSHAVVSSTPVPDIKLHIQAWRQHFGSIFGAQALERVKGFSPPEMHLPIHPDVCYEYVKALKECGYEWLLAQEHTIQNIDGSGIKRPHFPHRLVARNSNGEVAEITVLIKTQGSDTKLVAQMQPYYEAKSRGREDYQGKTIPPFVAQIGDGENGGVMMNEFPPCYKQAFNEIGIEGTVAMNGSEYLEFIRRSGLKESDFIPVQPIFQNRIWEHFIDLSPTKHKEEVNTAFSSEEKGRDTGLPSILGKEKASKGKGPEAMEKALEETQKKYHDFHLDKASWTNSISWVKGYENVLDPINKLSAEFHKKFNGKKADSNNAQYREALLYLLLSQTSCFRYWGQGVWTEYAKEICRRGMDALK